MVETVQYGGARSKEPPSCSRSVTRPTIHDLVPWSQSGGMHEDVSEAGLTETSVEQTPHHTPGKPFLLQSINCPNIVASAHDQSPAAPGHAGTTTPLLGLQHSTPVSIRRVPPRIEDYLLSSPLMPRGNGGLCNQAVVLREAAKIQQLSPRTTTPTHSSTTNAVRGGTRAGPMMRGDEKQAGQVVSKDVCVHEKGGRCNVHGEGAKLKWKPVQTRQVGPGGKVILSTKREYFYKCDLDMTGQKRMKQVGLENMVKKTTTWPHVSHVANDTKQGDLGVLGASKEGEDESAVQTTGPVLVDEN